MKIHIFIFIIFSGGGGGGWRRALRRQVYLAILINLYFREFSAAQLWIGGRNDDLVGKEIRTQC